MHAKRIVGKTREFLVGQRLGRGNLFRCILTTIKEPGRFMNKQADRIRIDTHIRTGMCHRLKRTNRLAKRFANTNVFRRHGDQGFGQSNRLGSCQQCACLQSFVQRTERTLTTMNNVFIADQNIAEFNRKKRHANHRVVTRDGHTRCLRIDDKERQFAIRQDRCHQQPISD